MSNANICGRFRCSKKVEKHCHTVMLDHMNKSRKTTCFSKPSCTNVNWQANNTHQRALHMLILAHLKKKLIKAKTRQSKRITDQALSIVSCFTDDKKKWQQFTSPADRCDRLSTRFLFSPSYSA